MSESAKETREEHCAVVEGQEGSNEDNKRDVGDEELPGENLEGRDDENLRGGGGDVLGGDSAEKPQEGISDKTKDEVWHVTNQVTPRRVPNSASEDERVMVNDEEAQGKDDINQAFDEGETDKLTQSDCSSLCGMLHHDSGIESLQSHPPQSLSRSRSFPTYNKTIEYFDMLLIYSKEDEQTHAHDYRKFAKGKKWKCTSVWELPIGKFIPKNFSTVMKQCTYATLLITDNFLRDKQCEKWSSIVIEESSRDDEFYECVLPIVYKLNEHLPAHLNAISHVQHDSEYFESRMTQAVDVQIRLDREMASASAILPGSGRNSSASSFSKNPYRSISVDTIETSSCLEALNYQGASGQTDVHAASKNDRFDEVKTLSTALASTTFGDELGPQIKVADTQLMQIALDISPHVYFPLGIELGLKYPELQQILSRGSMYNNVMMDILVQWRTRNGHHATCKNLSKLLVQAKLLDLAVMHLGYSKP